MWNSWPNPLQLLQYEIAKRIHAVKKGLLCMSLLFSLKKKKKNFDAYLN